MGRIRTVCVGGGDAHRRGVCRGSRNNSQCVMNSYPELELERDNRKFCTCRHRFVSTRASGETEVLNCQSRHTVTALSNLRFNMSLPRLVSCNVIRFIFVRQFRSSRKLNDQGTSKSQFRCDYRRRSDRNARYGYRQAATTYYWLIPAFWARYH